MHENHYSSVWDERWEQPTLTFFGRCIVRAKKNVIKGIVNGLHIQERVIEVGCGLGYTMDVFKEMGLSCVGIDASSEAVAFCKKRGLEATQAELKDITCTYDLVVSDGMLEHFLHFEPYAQDMMRISSKYVLLIQPNHESLIGKTAVYFAELFRGNINVYEYNYRRADFISVFKNNGYDLKKNCPIAFDIFRALLFEKHVG